MSPAIKGITIILLLLPPLFGVWALISREPTPVGVFLFLIALYIAVWLWCRPSRFVVSQNHLDIVFPGWRRRIAMRDISHIHWVSKEQFNQEFGWAIRIGVGGLWGGFGWLWTGRRGLVEFYVSTVDGLILIERSPGPPLLITPEHPHQFIEVTQAMLTSSS
ncbi:MAG: hypothetical protein SFY66_13015 [Oculatellaceae cyanobacterium bins.114]|nr:hypothetical protein [Oculatellaceae cyanobacterium bins.114]